MKKRNFGEIRFTDNNDGTLTLEHLVGEIKVPSTGGGYVLGVPCGAGKSTAVTSLVKLFMSEGFVIFEKTQQECNEAMGSSSRQELREMRYFSCIAIPLTMT